MDNASIYRLQRLEQTCAEAGVRLLKLAPYSPGLNPIEGLFAEIKTHADLFERDFETFFRLTDISWHWRGWTEPKAAQAYRLFL